ncbi:MAG: DUF368 domain-containing protein [Pseudohongiellaceae bacterium]
MDAEGYRSPSGLAGRTGLFFKGMAMGAADSIPGVSGGTIAFITNIYEELIFSIQSVNFRALKVLLDKGLAAFWQHINGSFLLILGVGIVLSLKLFAGVVLYLLENFQPQLLSFFCGLILASCWYMQEQIKSWQFRNMVLLLVGTIFAVSLALIPQGSGSLSLVYLFFCGAIAICAMILPGISGAFILILLGAYETVLGALNALQLDIIAVFVAGCGCGLIAFSNLLAYLFRHWRSDTLSLLLGILAGSLYSIWPWKTPKLEAVNANGEIEVLTWQNILPGEFARLNNVEVSVMLALILMIGGFVLVYGLEKLAGKSHKT